MLRTESTKRIVPWWCIVLFLLTGVLLTAAPALSIMPPEVYIEASENSKIKGIARVESVEVVEVGKRYTTKYVTFVMEHSLTPDAPARFTGACKTVETREQSEVREVGGNIYYNPRVNERVFVTVTHEGGEITTFTRLTPDLEKVVREQPDRLRYGMGGVTYR
jgi:hypothetical protein